MSAYKWKKWNIYFSMSGFLQSSSSIYLLFKCDVAAIKFKIVTALWHLFLPNGNNSKPWQMCVWTCGHPVTPSQPSKRLKTPGRWEESLADCMVDNLGFHVLLFHHEREETECHGDDPWKDQMLSDIPEDSEMWSWVKRLSQAYLSVQSTEKKPGKLYSLYSGQGREYLESCWWRQLPAREDWKQAKPGQKLSQWKQTIHSAFTYPGMQQILMVWFVVIACCICVRY